MAIRALDPTFFQQTPDVEEVETLKHVSIEDLKLLTEDFIMVLLLLPHVFTA